MYAFSRFETRIINHSGSLKPLDIEKYQEQQEIAGLIGEVGNRAVGDIGKAFDLEDGSAAKLALHGIVGAAQAKASGGSAASGAAAAVGSTIVNNQVADYLANSVLVDTEERTYEKERNSIQQITALASGYAISGATGGNGNALIGANVARDAEANNRQLHPDERRWIKQNAEKFAEQQGISTEEATERLAQQAARQTDLLWALALSSEEDKAAAEFLATANKTFTNESGKAQQFFTTQGKDFTMPQRYAPDARMDLDYYDKYLIKGDNNKINDRAKQIVADKAKSAADTLINDPKQAAKNTGEFVYNTGKAVVVGTVDCVLHPINCAVGVKDGFVENATAIGTGAASMKENDLQRLYGQDTRTAQGFILAGNLTEAGLTTYGGVLGKRVGGATVKAGEKAAVKQAEKKAAKAAEEVAEKARLERKVENNFYKDGSPTTPPLLHPDIARLQGTSPNVGDFTGLHGATMEEIVSRVPHDWTVAMQKDGKGVRFLDTAGNERIRVHQADYKAPVGSNSNSGWVLRISNGGKGRNTQYFDHNGNVGGYKDNDTHIPIAGNPVLNKGGKK